MRRKKFQKLLLQLGKQLKHLFSKIFFVQSIGVKVNEIIVEKKIAPIIVTASSLNSFAVSPSKKTMGIKMLIRTTDVDMIAKITSLEPDNAASNLEDPDSIFL